MKGNVRTLKLREVEAIATDYDRTLTTPDLRLEAETVEAMNRAHRAGMKLIIVSGRQLEFLLNTEKLFEHIDALVAENGAVIYVSGNVIEIGASEGEAIAAELKKRGVKFSKGRVISYVDRLHIGEAEIAVREVKGAKMLRNIDSAMIMPQSVDKDVGLKLALEMLGVPEENTVVAGDGENDISLFKLKSFKVALFNSVPAIKERADIVLDEPGGKGITKLINEIINHNG
jgi:phosphoglycolate phosphatase (TIGR01487 family)